MKKRLSICGISDTGQVRTSNQDYFGVDEGDHGSLIIVCDGMGGYEGGEVASRLAVEAIMAYIKTLGTKYDEKDELGRAIVYAHEKIISWARENPDLGEMGSTVVVLLVHKDEAFVAHVGDSRMYLIRGGGIRQMTKDHSLVQEMVDTGVISVQDARLHPYKNVIVRALGANRESVQPEIVGPLNIFIGDKFLLCTDGLTTHLEDDEILRLTIDLSAPEAAAQLVQVANERGGSDNITIQIVDVLGEG